MPRDSTLGCSSNAQSVASRIHSCGSWVAVCGALLDLDAGLPFENKAGPCGRSWAWRLGYGLGCTCRGTRWSVCSCCCTGQPNSARFAPWPGSGRCAWPCSLCAVLLGRAVVLVATVVVGCPVVVAGGAEVLGKAVLGSSAVVLGGAFADADGAVPGCAAGARTGAGATGSSVEVLGGDVLGGAVVG